MDTNSNLGTLYSNYISKYGIPPKSATQFKVFCKQNGITVSYKQCMEFLRNPTASMVSSVEPTKLPAPASTKSKSLLHEMDQLFAKYYASKNRNDYFDSENNGKFLALQKAWNYNNDETLKSDLERLDSKFGYFIREWENRPVDDIQSTFMRIFGDFPCFALPMHPNNAVNRYIQYCAVLVQLYQRQQVPSHRILTNFVMSKTEIHPSLSWRNIALSLKHQMYPLIGNTMESAIDDLKSNDSFKIGDFSRSTMDMVMAAVQKKQKLENKKVKFIENVVWRAKEFANDAEFWSKSSVNSLITTLKVVSFPSCTSTFEQHSSVISDYALGIHHHSIIITMRSCRSKYDTLPPGIHPRNSLYIFAKGTYHNYNVS